MKKLSYAIVAIFITASLSACSTSTAAEKEKKDETAGKTEKSKVQEVAINLTKEEFLAKVYNYETNTEEWVYEGDKPAIVDFYANWCQPCKIASPILEDLAKEYEGEIYVWEIVDGDVRVTDQDYGSSSVVELASGSSPDLFGNLTGFTNFETEVKGTDDDSTTYNSLITKLNDDTSGATWEINDGNIRLTSNSTGTGSTALLTNGTSNDLVAELADI
ncbi:MAG: thioredoxin domain-containing protein, partial [Bacteroidales bacterium]